MKIKFKLILTFIAVICMIFYACNTDNNFSTEDVSHFENDESQNSSQMKGGGCPVTYNNNKNCVISGPNSIIPGNTYTFTMNCSESSVTWVYPAGVTPVNELPNGLGSSSESFTFSSSFDGNSSMTVICGQSFDCKGTISFGSCPVNPPPSCSITGPNCGLDGDQLSYSFSGGNGSTINWSTTSGITLTSPQGNSFATFELSDPFNGGTISATKFGNPSCTVNFPISNCCKQQTLKIDNENRILKE